MIYDYDLIIDCGKIGKRGKGASRQFRGTDGHASGVGAEGMPAGADMHQPVAIYSPNREQSAVDGLRGYLVRGLAPLTFQVAARVAGVA